MKQLLGLAVSFVLAPVALAGSWVVAPDPGPGVDFTSVQAAVDGAGEGDLLLISGGFSESVVIDGKSVTLQGLTGAGLFSTLPGSGSTPLVEIRNLTAGQEVHLRGMSLVRITGEGGDTIRLDGNAGRVWLEELFVDTYDGHALVADASVDVVLSEVFLQPNAAFLDGGVPTSAGSMVLTGGSVVHGFDVDATGSHGPPLFTTPTGPQPGGTALLVVDSQLHLEGGHVGGGSGGTFFSGGCVSAATGGAALSVQTAGGTAPVVTLRDVQLSGGTSGFHDPTCAPAPPQAPTLDDPSGAVSLLPGKARLLQLPSTPTSTGAFEFQLIGEPGEAYLLFASPGVLTPTPLPGFVGELLLDPTGSFLAASGNLDALGFDIQGAAFVNPGPPLAVHAQAVLLDAQGTLRFSSPGSILFP